MAWDTDRNDWRTFRVDRIQDKVSAGHRFVPREPPAQDLAVYVARGAFTHRCRARVKVLAPAEAIAAKLPAGIGLVEPIDKRSCYFDVGASSFEGLAMQLMFLGVDFEVGEPPELVEQIQRFADRYHRAIV